MLDKIDHLGIAVPDLKLIEKTFEDAFELKPIFREEVAEQKVKVLGFHIGESTIEYLEPTAEDSPISKFLKKNGSGIHHIAYRVKNLSDTLGKLQTKGFKLIDEKPRDGAEGKKIAFLHPKSFNGILIELCETP